MKKTLAIIVSAALVTALSAGATLAYFTSSDTALNKVTMGNVKVSVSEAFTPGQTGIVPNQSIVKVVKAKNDGTNPEYVCVKLTRYWDKTTTPVASPEFIPDGREIQFLTGSTLGTGAGWVEVGSPIYNSSTGTVTDYYLYGSSSGSGPSITYTPNSLANKNDLTTSLIDAFQIKNDDANNSYFDFNAHIDVAARSIQSANIPDVDVQTWVKAIW